MIENKDPNIVEVEWVDSMILNHGEWMDLDEVDESLSEKSMYHKSVGYLARESDVAIAVCISINAQDDMQSRRISGGMVIPKAAIKSMVVLKDNSSSN